MSMKAVIRHVLVLVGGSFVSALTYGYIADLNVVAAPGLKMHRNKRCWIAIGGWLILLVYMFVNYNVECDSECIAFREIRYELEKDAYEQRSREIATVFSHVKTGPYILNNPYLCTDTDKLMALVLVNTAPGHFERRQNIRSTYGSRDLFQNKVRVLFLLGTVENNILRDAIIQEHKQYRDTIQGNFFDSYQNLTYKGVMGFRWITEHCTHAKYIIKVDDDAVLDMWRYLNYLEITHYTKSIICPVVPHPLIEREGKWKVFRENFKNIDRWPFDYCPGFVVILTGDVIDPLFEAALTTSFLWIDDVYLYGLLPYKVGNITLVKLPERLKVSPHENGERCLMEKGNDCEFAAVGLGYIEKNFHVFWNLIKKRNGIK